MDPISILGKKFAEVESHLDHTGIAPVFDVLEEGEEQSFSVSSADSSWELSLGEGERIESIFLYPERGAVLPLGIRREFCRADVVAFLAEPSRSGEESNGLLGPKGGWDRFDKEMFSLHVQYAIGGRGISLVTVMLPEVAP